jgi:hypothetical protein
MIGLENTVRRESVIIITKAEDRDAYTTFCAVFEENSEITRYNTTGIKIIDINIAIPAARTGSFNIMSFVRNSVAITKPNMYRTQPKVSIVYAFFRRRWTITINMHINPNIW